ncbi:MAG: NAD-glutamate dehydrogenase [Actinomycetota bacterium]|nr:NAD-glutamate dehydrogenase [Actinomycetota bacterium]
MSERHAAHPLLGELEELIASRESPPRDERLTSFARVLLGRTLHERLRTFDLEELYRQTAGLYDFADARGLQPIAVRVVESPPAGTALEVNVPDAPFLVDTVRAAVQGAGHTVRLLLHPIVGVERDAEGRIARIADARGASGRESVMRVELERHLAREEGEVLVAAVREALWELQLAVGDFAAMLAMVERMENAARGAAAARSAEEVEETTAFLQWLRDGHFILLGARAYAIEEGPSGPAVHVQDGSGLGILRDDGESRFAQPTPVNELPEFLRERLVATGELLVIGKTNRRSRVHRRARMDDVSVRVLRPDGSISGLLRVIGLFTSLVYLEQASRTPVLRRKLQAIIEAEGLMEGSHDYKATVAAFESFPRDELFQAPIEALRAEIVAAARAEEAQRVTLTVRRDSASRNVTVMVAMPGDRMSTELRMRLQELLAQRFHAESAEYHLALVEGAAAQLFFLLHVPEGEAPDVPLPELEQEVARLARTWDDRLADELVARSGDAEGKRLAALYSARLPDYYKTSTPPDLALADIALLERVAAGEAFAVGIQNELAGHTQVGARPLTRVTVATPGGKIPLGELLPVLEALGLTVMEEVPTRLDGGDDGAYLHDFGVLVDDAQLDCERDGERLAEAITAIWGGRCESDTLNALVVRAGLRAEDVVILRAYRRYRRIVAPTFTAAYQNDVLCAHPRTARSLVELFRARFCEPVDVAREEELRARVSEQLAAVGSLDEDRILRGFAALMDATVRTNAALGRPYLSFKLRSADVPQMPEPAPLYEIFVYHPLVEGIHLRGGHVARGGIRWSDRREDYRSEVLGLMKAQMVKNAVIVPVGAKGGFVLRAPPADRQLLRAEVQLRYSTFIRGLLDVTDNIAGGEVVHPAGVRALDEDDPYLVVAADKGTAALSDTANGIALEYGFWLGDAFASGGSKGYDHKQLGITARGAWESVKRHFRELGRDVDSRPFTVAGIGDMSGDVFGNGMLLSRQIRLVAAFDHRHVFLDPSPDVETSFAERKRLFALGAGTSWMDYDPALMSAGGGVWARTEKSVPLSPEVRAALGVEAESLDPDELVRAILRAPVDLLWNGGVGTFVKASSESHAEVGDRDNDAIRVDGRELRARVVGEGGNLGLTQRGRIEYASAGGRINTDAIDNSAGVDTSDHEVNIKILLGAAVERGSMTFEGRDELLAAAAGEVCDLVLYDNYLQAQILSQEQETASQRVEAHEMLMRELELEGLLHRELEALPPSDELTDRQRQGRGLTRPELAVLMAYAKRSLYPKVLASAIPDDPALDSVLRSYFPRRIVEATGELYREHRLRREIVATFVTNDVVNSLGIAWAWQMMAETGAEAAEVVRAYWIAREVTGSVARWEEVEALFTDPAVDTDVQMEVMVGVDGLVEGVSRWYLQHANDGDAASVIARDRASFSELSQTLRGVGSDAWRADHALQREALAARGLPLTLAEAAAWRSELTYAPDVIAAARATGCSLAEAADAFFALGERLHLDWLEEQIGGIVAETRWQRWALAAVRDELHATRRELTEQVIVAGRGAPMDEAVTRFLAERSVALARVQRLVANLRADGMGDTAAAMVGVRQVRSAFA